MCADFDPSDRTPVDVVAAVFDLTPAAQPAAPISPQEIAEMRNAYRRTTPGRWNWWTSNSMYRLSTTHDGKDGGVLSAFIAKDGVPDISMSQADRAFVEMAHERFPALLDAIEALTAKNQRLTDALNTSVLEAREEIDDRLKPEIERLTAENAQLKARLEISHDHPYDGIACRDETIHQQDRLIGELRAELRELRLQYLADFGQRYQPEMYATTDHGWYATQRAKVEADHAAAKEGAQ